MTLQAREFVFCDSEVSSVAIEGDILRVRFAAAHVTEPDATSLAGRVRGYVDGVELRCLGGPWAAFHTNGLVGRLVEGRVSVGGSWRGRLPLPVTLDGPMPIELRFANQSELIFTATSFSLMAPPGAVFGESFAC